MGISFSSDPFWLPKAMYRRSNLSIFIITKGWKICHFYLKFFRGEQKTDKGAFLPAHPTGLKHLKKLIWSMPLQIYMSMWLEQYFMLLLGCKWAWWVFWYLLPRSSFVTAILNTHTEPKKQKALQTNPDKRSIVPVIFHFCTSKNSSENILFYKMWRAYLKSWARYAHS